jgi:hypothetical protein
MARTPSPGVGSYYRRDSSGEETKNWGAMRSDPQFQEVVRSEQNEKTLESGHDAHASDGFFADEVVTIKPNHWKLPPQNWHDCDPRAMFQARSPVHGRSALLLPAQRSSAVPFWEAFCC